MASLNFPLESVQASSPLPPPPTSISSLAPLPSLGAKALPVTMHDRKIDNIIFDIGDALFTWTWPASASISIPLKTLRWIFLSTTWFEYEKGNIGEEETYRLVAEEFSLDASEVGAAFRAARHTLQINSSMITFLRDLKKNSDIRLFAMSNISVPDWEALKRKARPEDWALFDHIFTSATVHERKPNLGYFRHVLEYAGIDPSRTAFVDDKLENIVSGRSVGLKGIIFTSADEVMHELRTLVRNPIADGEEYLRTHAKRMDSVTNSGVVVDENFAQLLILEATGDESLVDYVKYPHMCNFFKSAPVLTTISYPDDLDTTSLACTVLDYFLPETKNDIMNEMLALKNKDGIIQTLFDTMRPRIDPVVCVNILTFFHANGRGGDVKETFDWVFAVLKNRAYINGTHYYYGPDTFLYFLSRLLSVSPYTRQYLGPLFARRVMDQFGCEGDALALAMRIHAAATVYLCDSRDYERLARMQDVDGSWPLGWAYKFGTTGVLIGNKGLTTALAVSAMRRYKELELHLHPFY